ncbi:hypothetical protein SAMN05216283_11145 [Sunxiuqinia elliptica]|uniref:Uncharacterized protein n=1 Tax=Sunxiuqinia elliptica TaxID=655355 RepID=A0A1I2KDG2_9BACT|nr:hypothetical protein SAMN05216283_11145 [Sunxiuqinia elliptica]
MYWSSILYLLTWPVLVIASYHLVKFVVKKYTTVFEKIED